MSVSRFVRGLNSASGGTLQAAGNAARRGKDGAVALCGSRRVEFKSGNAAVFALDLYWTYERKRQRQAGEFTLITY